VADPTEYAKVADVIVEAFTASFPVSDFYRADMRNLAEHARHFTVWVAEDPSDGRILGTVLVQRADAPTHAPGEVDGERGFRLLSVAPAGRGLGLGKALVAHAIAQIAAQGCRTVGIWSGPQMVAAHRVYEHFGFRRRPERETFTVDGGQRPLAFTLDLPDPEPSNPAKGATQ
ncbi:MAG: GNAT family N-acetyltransferase, partial [Bifidobacteriaceae bacterium]|jgi:GNAT superfamily N-acetyltransferase|nr:GNAT family N-acetyltransferase [Bifidobacteriaceae bacterium]